MLINGRPLNAGPLASAGGARQLPDPVPAPVSIVWGARVMLGSEDVTAQLTGQVRVEREEGAAAIAEFTLFLPKDTTVDVVSWTGRDVAVYYRELRDGVWMESQRFSGWLEQPTYDPRNRTVSCEATDRLQDLVEALSIEAIDGLVGGQWSEDVFDAVDGRSHWDYAGERMGTRAASLDRSVDGELRVTDWPRTTPAFVFGAGTTVDASLSVQFAKLSDRVNRVELSIDYRFSRLRERHQSWVWEHPDIQGWNMDLGFCIWRHDPSELPTTDMVNDALSSAGYKLLAGYEFMTQPLSGVYCTPPAGWINIYDNLLLAAKFTGGMRWSQSITETYTLTVEAPTSVEQAGEVLRRDGTSLESELDRESEWEDEEFTAPAADAVQDAIEDWVVDLRETDRLQSSVQCQLATAQVTILSAHRANQVSWQVPTSMALGVDLVHTVRLEDRCVAEGKVFSLVDEWDMSSQTALSTITLAVSRGGGVVTDPADLPDPPYTEVTGDVPVEVVLPSQIRGHDSTAYDDAEDGFSGNYDNIQAGSPGDAFERRFQLTAPEVPAEHRDEFTAEKTQTFRVAIPNDPLEL